MEFASHSQVLEHYATPVRGGAVSLVGHWRGHQGGHHQGVVRQGRRPRQPVRPDL